MDWRGYIPAVTTPFSKDGALDVKAAKSLLRWMLEQGMHGVNLLGTQGEWFSMNREEKHRLLKAAGDLLKNKLTLITGCSAFTAAEVIENINVAADCGFDGVLVTPPPYIRPSEGEIHAFYRDINDASALPVCVYNWPPGAGLDMSLSLLSRLSELNKVVAIKNSTASLRHFLDVFFALKDSVRVFGVPMNEFGAGLVKHYGADGTMGAGAILGSEQPDFFNCIWSGDLAAAIQLGKRDETLMQAWFNPDYTGKFGSSQAIFKEALNQQGLPGGYPRRPILPLDEKGVESVRATLLKLGRIPG